ncbi:exodeoxyribonuclease VII large subunit [Mobilicoccus pelagius]|uniref:Exodeoxyribonuclease 7 large subunit n=1 Tax=Mobilicoccus pelagius NBRC 104925 TaxID=1089455 RepID=H5URA3_9MICO|nr:exodeoxyribonuclease VII large subunit [Mobilicoccus pelagius]GAB48261.1 exodeoxyribonuclease VII large subunit [Mobilicoccus pelagius NBRC 104925]
MSEPLPAKAAETTAERPWPLRLLSMKITDYVDRMSPVWIEGQIVQLNRRPGSRTCFVTLRDADVDMSMTVTVPTVVLDRMPITEGSRVVTHAKPAFWSKRGSMQLEARDMRPVGEGELLARLEHLKRTLAAEGLFAMDRKRPLPFLPQRVGLVCGRASAAMRDVLEVARRRWPAVEFEVREVPVQGADAVLAVTRTVQELDALPHVDVIVVTRGGGSFEDLLPFSNESLVRAVAETRTPVVSAIGHEVDTPLLDFVADVRASTPTDAAKRIVPDVEVERAGIAQLAGRAQGALAGRIAGERRHLVVLRSRPVLTDPHATLAPHREALARHRDRGERALTRRLDRERGRIDALAGQLRALSPQGTLDRGYAIVLHADGRLVTDREDVDADEILRVKVARGDFGVRPVTRREARS